MTIEEKAKRYDEALKKAKITLDCCGSTSIATKNTVYDIFPELRESEDEKIRKELIKHLKEGVEGYMPAGGSEDYARWLAWLEKQGEQKPADKVVPKFQNGQWIVWQNKCYKVNYNGCGYELIDQNGLSTSLEYGTVDASARLWDITKDAKKGDVLQHNGCTFIFICIEKGVVRGFEECLYNGTKTCNFGKPNKDNDYSPATKEQRDTIFAKMKEEGYEWSEETHELKKISQRMVSAEAKEALYDKPTDEEMKELLRTEYEKGRADAIAEMYVPTQISPEESLGVSSEKYEDIVDTLTQCGQKPAKWSLEDEKVIAIINNALTESNTPPDDYDKVYDWLESLRKRIGG